MAIAMVSKVLNTCLPTRNRFRQGKCNDFHLYQAFLMGLRGGVDIIERGV